MSETAELFEGHILPLDTVIKEYGNEMTRAFQAAFAGEPWLERSKCVTPEYPGAQCRGGFSSLETGSVCGDCNKVVCEEAYPADELIARFKRRSELYETVWYVESNSLGEVALFAYGTYLNNEEIATDRYRTNEAMREWSREYFSDTRLFWLNEVFVDRAVRSTGNLRNFGGFLRRMAEQVGADRAAYTTINTRMIHAARRDFDESQVHVFSPEDIADYSYLIDIALSKSR